MQSIVEDNVLVDSKLNEKLRNYMNSLGISLWMPTTQALHEAISSFFPEMTPKSVQETCDSLGLPVITRIYKTNYSMSPAKTMEEATAQLEKYSQAPYPQIRKSLNIQHHWVLKVREQTWLNSINDLVDAHTYFDEIGEPEIFIFDL
jgi:hypothetical protein